MNHKIEILLLNILIIGVKKEWCRDGHATKIYTDENYYQIKIIKFEKYNNYVAKIYYFSSLGSVNFSI